jgi:hypothetical protein
MRKLTALRWWLAPKRTFGYGVPQGWDLAHPVQSTASAQPVLRLEWEITNITIDPFKSALAVIDMQNPSMSARLGVNVVPAFLEAQKALLDHAIPAAQRANI